MIMKKPYLFFLIFFGIFVLNVSIVKADERIANFHSIVLEDFELKTDGTPRRSWAIVPNRFGREGNVDSGKSLQKLTWIKAWPQAIFGQNGEFDDGIEKKSYKTCLALWVAFNRPGYNFVDIYPVEQKDGKYHNKPVPFRGRVKQVDLWIWGSNHNYNMEMVLIDFHGIEHRIPIGNIKHAGWKNFTVNIPNYVPQSGSYIPSLRQLSLVKLVVWSTPKEKVSGAYIYIDHIKYLSDIFETKFDGYNLGVTEEVKDLWEKAPKGPEDIELVP